MAPIKLTHDQTIDALVARLAGKHTAVMKNSLYFKGRNCIGEMDVATIDWANGKTYIHYYEVKTGRYSAARKEARHQARRFLEHYDRPNYVATFIFYHPEKGFERWKK